MAMVSCWRYKGVEWHAAAVRPPFRPDKVRVHVETRKSAAKSSRKLMVHDIVRFRAERAVDLSERRLWLLRPLYPWSFQSLPAILQRLFQ